MTMFKQWESRFQFILIRIFCLEYMFVEIIYFQQDCISTNSVAIYSAF